MIQGIKCKIFEISQEWGKKIGLDLSYFVKNGFWIFIRQIVCSILGVAITVGFARLVQKGVFGQYQLVLSIFSVISILSIPGLNTSVARSIARGNDGDYKNSVKVSFLYSLIGIPILVLIGAYYCYFDEKIIGVAILISSIFFPFYYAPNTWSAVFLGKSRFDVQSIYSIIQSFVNTSTTILVFFFTTKLIPIIVTYLFTFSLINIIFYFKSLKYISNDKKDKGTIRYGFFLTFTNSAELISDNLDKIIIGLMLSPVNLAAYSIVSIFPLKFRSVLKPFLNIFFPKMTSDSIRLNNIFKKNRKILFFLFGMFILMGLLYFFLIEKISLIFFGVGYEDYYYLSKYFAIFIVISLPLFFLSRYAYAKKLNKTILITSPFFVIFKTIILIAFTYFFGLIGSVIAFNICALVKFVLISVLLIFKHD